VDRLEQSIRKAHPEMRRIFIEAENIAVPERRGDPRRRGEGG
jgi:hypothetical protein